MMNKRRVMSALLTLVCAVLCKVTPSQCGRLPEDRLRKIAAEQIRLQNFYDHAVLSCAINLISKNTCAQKSLVNAIGLMVCAWDNAKNPDVNNDPHFFKAKKYGYIIGMIAGIVGRAVFNKVFRALIRFFYQKNLKKHL